MVVRCPECGSIDGVGPGYDTDFFCWDCCTSFFEEAFEVTRAFFKEVVSDRDTAKVAVIGLAVIAVCVGGYLIYKKVRKKK